LKEKRRDHRLKKTRERKKESGFVVFFIILQMFGQQHRRRYRNCSTTSSSNNSSIKTRTSNNNNNPFLKDINDNCNTSIISILSVGSDNNNTCININNSICSTIDNSIPIDLNSKNNYNSNNTCWDPFFLSFWNRKNTTSYPLLVPVEVSVLVPGSNSREEDIGSLNMVQQSKQSKKDNGSVTNSTTGHRSNTTTALATSTSSSKNGISSTTNVKSTVKSTTNKKKELPPKKLSSTTTNNAANQQQQQFGQKNQQSIFGTISLDTKFYRYIDRIKGNDPTITKVQLSLRRDVTTSTSTGGKQQQQQQQQTITKHSNDYYDNKSIDSLTVQEQDMSKMNTGNTTTNNNTCTSNQLSSNHSVCSATSNTTGSDVGTSTVTNNETRLCLPHNNAAGTPLKQQQLTPQRSVNGDVLIKQLASALKSNTVVTDVFCRNLQISSIRCINFTQTVLSYYQHCTLLTFIDLSYNTTIGNAGACAIASAIAQRNNQCILNSNNKSKNKTACVPIQKLYLDGCSIGTEGVLALLHKVLPVNNILQTKNTNNKTMNNKNNSKHNHPNHRRTVTIVPLKEPSLRSNDLGTNGSIHAICDLLKMSQQPELSPQKKNSPSSRGHDIKMEEGPKLPKIDKLLLSSNNIDNDAAQCLSEALVLYYHNNQCLSFVKSLSLDDNSGITGSSSYALSRLVPTLIE
jgi:Leucine Rich repeat